MEPSSEDPDLRGRDTTQVRIISVPRKDAAPPANRRSEVIAVSFLSSRPTGGRARTRGVR